MGKVVSLPGAEARDAAARLHEQVRQVDTVATVEIACATHRVGLVTHETHARRAVAKAAVHALVLADGLPAVRRYVEVLFAILETPGGPTAA